jgi:hypothetical protein
MKSFMMPPKRVGGRGRRQKLSRWMVGRIVRFAIKCRNRGWIDLSIRIMHNLVRMCPRILVIRVLLAKLLCSVGDDEAAADALAPNEIDSSENLALHATRIALLHAQIGYYHLAKKYYEIALRRDSPSCFTLWSTAQVFPEDTDAIVGACRRLSDLETTDERKRGALVLMAEALSDAGRPDARQIFLEILSKDPTCTGAYSGLVECEHIASPSDSVVKEMRERLASQDITKMSKLKHLHFALGHVYDRAGDCSRAMTHFLLGNSIRLGEGATIDIDVLKQFRLLIRKTFTKEFVESLSPHGCQEDKLICVVGMPRSGTSLIHQILSESSKIVGLGESSDFARLVLNLNFRSNGDFPKCVTRLKPLEIQQHAMRLRNKFVQIAGTERRVVIKTPDYYQHLGLIKILFPKTKIIHCKRDPLDNCLSCFSQDFGYIPYSTDLYVLSEVYKSYLQMMFHWSESVFPGGTIYDLEYEALVANPEANVKAVCEFLGLEFDQKYLEFYKSGKPIATASRWQVRRPVNTRSVKRASAYREFLGPVVNIDGFNPDPSSAET